MRGPVAPPSDRPAAPVALPNEVYVNGGERGGGVPFQQEPAAPGRSDAGGSSSPSRIRVGRSHPPAMAPPPVLAQAQGLSAAEGQQQQQQQQISSAAAPALATVAGHANSPPTAVAAQGGPSRLAVTSDPARSRTGPGGAALGVDGAVNGINKLQLQPPAAAQHNRRPATGSSSSTREGATLASSGSGSSIGSGQALRRVHPGVPVEHRFHHQQPQHLQQQQQQQPYHHQHQHQHQQHQQQLHQRRAHGPPVVQNFYPAPRTSRQQETQQLIGGGGGGARWLVDSFGRQIAPAESGARWLVDINGRQIAPAEGSVSSPPVAIINPSRKRLPVPMAVASGTPTIYPGCQECRELVKARLDEPVLLCEDRHRPGVFDTTTDGSVCGGAGGAEGGASGRQQQHQQHQQHQQLARKRGSTWRLRERTTTFNLGLILCLNIG
ncbi:unnamed protein product, partial [Laminaria digitata]